MTRFHHPPAHRFDPKKLRQRMVDNMHKNGIHDTTVLAAMGLVPRHLFVQEALSAQAYEETPLPIGFGQTISQPYVVAYMSQALHITPGMRVLEIGTGSGYQAAVLAAMGCKVYTVERVRELHAATNALIKHLHLRNIHTKQDDGTLGMPEAAPFDRIIVTAGGPKIPKPLCTQLEDKGILLIPVGTHKREQRLLRICRQEQKFTVEDLGNAIFVDLVGNHGW